MTEFSCDYDSKVMLTTLIICSIIAIATIIFIGLFIYKFRKSCGAERIGYIIGIVALLIPPILPYLTSRSALSSLSVDDNKISINLRKGSLDVPLNSVKEIRTYTADDDQNTIRTNASGGLWGYSGDYNNPQLGDFKQYSTNKDKRILIKTTGTTWVVSCAEPDRFIEVVKEKINK